MNQLEEFEESIVQLPILFKKCRIESSYEAYVTAFDRPSGNMLSGTSGMVIHCIANGSTIDLVDEERVKDLDGGIVEWARIKSLKPEYDFYYILANTLMC